MNNALVHGYWQYNEEFTWKTLTRRSLMRFGRMNEFEDQEKAIISVFKQRLFPFRSKYILKGKFPWRITISSCVMSVGERSGRAGDLLFFLACCFSRCILMYTTKNFSEQERFLGIRALRSLFHSQHMKGRRRRRKMSEFFSPRYS